MKDFDALRSEREQRERSFKIAGREFTFRPALPAHAYSLYLELMDRMREGSWPPGSFEILNATIIELLEEASRSDWDDAIANDHGNPISFEDMNEVIDYCIKVQTGRPTTQPSASSSSGGSGTTRSTDGSASQVAREPALSTSVPG